MIYIKMIALLFGEFEISDAIDGNQFLAHVFYWKTNIGTNSEMPFLKKMAFL